MANELTYKDYVTDSRHMSEYSGYQTKYARTIRESDRVLLDLVLAQLEPPNGTVLDIGCSTGNFLLHLRRAAPEAKLTGGDVVPAVIDACRSNPELMAIEFAIMDMLQKPVRTFDIVVANAALMFFSPSEFRTAIANLGSMVAAKGSLIVFDYFHPWDQELSIVETSRAHPHGLKFFQRSYSQVSVALAAAGLTPEEFRPFDIPIDLPAPADRGDITTHTVRTAQGVGLSFRGTLFQPWCHLVARKRS